MSIHLPEPTGPYAVGRRRFDLVDESRDDPFARRRGVKRKLALSAWYPAVVDDGARRATYLPGAWRAVSWLWGLHGRAVRPHAAEDALPASGRYPLVIFSPSANPSHAYTALLEEIASHGYVVVGISHPYESMPVTAFARGWPRLARLRSLGGALGAPGSRPYERDLAERAEVVAIKAADIAFVAASVGDDLPVDRARWAAIGHSFGGGAVADICRPGTTCRAGVTLDGGLWRAPDEVVSAAPILQLFAEHPEYTEPIAAAIADRRYVSAEYASADRATTVGAWHMLHDSATPGHSALVREATHTSFSDWPLLAPRRWSPVRRALAGVSGPAVWRTTTRAVVAFLDHYVRDRPGDVAAALAADPGLRVADPAALFSAHPVAVA
jgi:hypothetical protein